MSQELIPASIDLSHHTNSIAALALQLGYEGDLSVGALEDGVRLYQRRTVEDCLEMGKCLVLLKESTPHGEFKQRISMLNINERTARRFMSVALKFSKNGQMSVLKAAGSQSKLLELLVLDDDEIAELNENGSVNDITLDDIDCMTASELRKKIREMKADASAKDQDLQAKDQIIGAKDKRNNELLEENTKLKSPAQIKMRAETEEQALEKAALETLNTASITFLNALMRYQNEVNSVLDTAEKKGIPQLFERVDEAVIATYQRIAQYSRSLNVQIDFTSMVTPEWMSLQAADLPPIEVDGEA